MQKNEIRSLSNTITKLIEMDQGSKYELKI